MAYIAQNQEDNNFNQANQNTTSDNNQQGATPPANQNPPQSQNSPATGGGGGAPVQSSAAPSVKAPVNVDNASKPSTSGNFTNLKSYINANQNFNGGQGLAGKTYNQLNNQAQTAQANVDQSANQFQQQANQNRRAYDPNFVTQATTDSANFVKDPNNVSNFQNNFWNANYAGPAGLANAQDLTLQAQKVKGLTDQVGTESGRYALLQNLYGNSNYSTGQQQLDNLLLQGNSNQLGYLQSAKDLGGNLNAATTDAIANASNIGKQYADEAAATKAQTRDVFGNAVTGYQSDLDARTVALNAQREQEHALAQQQLTNAQVTQDLLAKTGLKQGQDIFGLQLQNYLNNTPVTATKDNAATAADQARFNALSQLSSRQDLYNYVTPQQAADAVQINQAGILAALPGAYQQAIGNWNAGAYNPNVYNGGGNLFDKNFSYGSTDPRAFSDNLATRGDINNAWNMRDDNTAQYIADLSGLGNIAKLGQSNFDGSLADNSTRHQTSDDFNYNQGFGQMNDAYMRSIGADPDAIRKTIQLLTQPTATGAPPSVPISE